MIDASGWKQLDDTDLVDVHDYGSELTKHLEKRRDDIPLWIGELGGLSLLEAPAAEPPAPGGKTASPSAPLGGTGEFVYRHVDDLADGYARLIEQIPDDVVGFCWTQLADVEQEQNGLLTADRRPKADPAAIRAVNERFLRA